MSFMETAQKPHQLALISYRTDRARDWGWFLSFAQRALAEPGGGGGVTTVEDRVLELLSNGRRRGI
jgi:hypothetical protein